MSQLIARISAGLTDFDTTNGGGLIQPGPLNLLNVFVEGFPISILGDIITPHSSHPVHVGATVIIGSPTVYSYGANVTLNGSLCSCGHIVEAHSIKTTA